MPLGECANRHLYNKNKYGDTCPICGVVASKYKEDGKTPEEIAEMYRVPEDKYICGWLACIEGVNRGRSYEIHPGNNFIGSEDTMHIQILGDKKVSRIRHAIIAYNEKNFEFVIFPGESKGLIYCKGEAVYTPKTLTALSIIEIGDSKFVFVPLCSKTLNWGGKMPE